MPLNDREVLVVATKVMHFSEKEAMAYLAAHNINISVPTYYRTLGRISAETQKRLFDICKNMKELHLERIDELRTIKKEMWLNYHKEKNPSKKVVILREIKEMQPYLSAYDEATQSILEESVKQFGNQENINLSALGI